MVGSKEQIRPIHRLFHLPPSDRGNFNSSAIAPDSQFCGISGECHERGSGED
ncbi:MAG: hypothetical protein HC851_20370 [Acaryochloris sp. RU_4_1]|nr:hypothetical protein [Acaryochloris sp. RU_4_1]